jgi:hypothetical protein
MKKLIVRSFVVALVLMLALTAVVSGASTTKNLSTNFTVVNLGPAAAVVNIDYVKEDGTPWTPSNFTTLNLTANGGQAIVAQYNDILPTGKGSVVLSSNQPLGAVVQILARGQTPTSGAYSGFTTGSSMFYIPLVMRRVTGAGGVLANSQVMVQNTTAADVTVDVQFIGTTSWTKQDVLIHPGATFYYDLEGETNLAVGWVGSAVVDAGAGKVAVVSNLFSGAHGLQTFNAFPEEAIGTSWGIPLFASRLTGSNLNTPVAVQNLSGGSIAIGGVTMDCTGATDFSVSNTAAIANNAAYYFNPVTNMTIPGNWYGSCVVDAGAANVVVFVQMRKPNVSDEVASYEAFNTSTTDTKVFVPLAAKRLAVGTATAITFQNMSGDAAVVKLTYKRSPSCTVGLAEYVVSGVSIAGNGQLIQNLRLTGTMPTMPAGWFGTLTLEDDPVDVTAARPIVGFVQITNFVGAAGDTLMAHNAFTQP